MRARADAWRTLEADPDLVAAKLVADAWCAAFVQPKNSAGRASTSGQGITHATLRDLSENPESVPDTIVTQVNDLARQYRFFHWHLEFPGIFTVPDDGSADAGTGWTGGFSCVIGNPPWEAGQDPGQGVLRQRRPRRHRRRGDRRDPQEDDRQASPTPIPTCFRKYRRALRQSDGTAHLLLKSGRYPFTGQGDVNTYSVFAETMRTVTSPTGAAGVITPTGLATDKTTAPFFADTLSNNRLVAFYDFENEAKIFRDVDHRYRFAVTTMTGTERKVEADTVRLPHPPHLRRARRGDSSWPPTKFSQLNPNTGTLPMFRSRSDADITLGIYRRHPVLIRDDDPDGNPWGLSFARLFDMANDSGLFHQRRRLRRRDSSTAGPTGATARSTCRCTRRRCSATSTTASRPIGARRRRSSTWAHCRGLPTSSTTTQTSSR